MVASRRFEGKVVLITASTAGIGLGIAHRFGHEGAKLVICSRRQANVDDTLKQLRGKGFEAVGAAANVNPTAGAILDTPDWAIDKLLQVNIKSAIQLLREAKPYMSKGSSIVVIASNAAYSPEPPIALYGVTKMALVSLSQALAAELGPEGIRVNAVAPGVVPTKFAAALVEDPAMEEMQRERTWLKRLGTPEDMAAAVAYLASEEAGYVTGECLVVGGGGYSHL